MFLLLSHSSLCHYTQNRDDALSPAGQEQIVAACAQLQRDLPTVVKYSLAAACIDTANIVGRELRLGRDRLVPEFTFLDPRAVGAWDMTDKSLTVPAIWALDADEAGRDGVGGRPPPNEDGTPHEVLADQAIRLRQVLSILETQSSGETYLLIFPDGTGPALLSAMMAGIPYNRVHELEFAPGEVRMDVTMASTNALWKSKQQENGDTYQAILKQGRANLQNLRSEGGIVNLKDQKMEAERIEIDEEVATRNRERERARQEEEQARLQLQRQLQQQNGDNSNSVSPSGLAAGVLLALGGAAAAAIGVGGGGDDKEKGTMSAQASMITNSTTPLLSTPPLEQSSTAGVGSSTSTATKTAGLYASTLPARERVNGTRNSTFVAEPEVILDPKEAARQAMDEYMNRDDGATDWLMSLNDIIEEVEADDGIDAESELVTQPAQQNQQGSSTTLDDDDEVAFQ